MIKPTREMMLAALNAGDMPDDSNAWAAVNAVLDVINDNLGALKVYRIDGEDFGGVVIAESEQQVIELFAQECGCDVDDVLADVIELPGEMVAGVVSSF